MCRLMAYASLAPHTFSEIVGPHFDDFTALAKKHGDGWGIASATSNHSTIIHLEPTSALKSSKYETLTHEAKSDAAILHLRWATLDLSITEANTHPFTHGDFSFIHNGSIKPPQSLDGYIDQDFFLAMKGETDSERYFFSLLSAIRKIGLKDGVVETIRKIRNECDFSSLNGMLLTPHKIVIISEFNPVKIPAGEPLNYYDLAYKKSPENVLVASSGWEQSGWTAIGNHRVVLIDRAKLEIESFEI